MAKRGRGVASVDEDESTYMHRSKDHAGQRFIAQGALSEISSSLSSSYIVPFARIFTQNTAYIGFLSAFSGLLTPLGNLWGTRAMRHHSRKRIHLTYTLLQTLIWLPLIAVSFLYWNNIATTVIPAIILVSYSLFIFFSAAKDPASFSWLGDLVSAEQRGHYFAKRNRIIGAWGLVIFMSAGFALRIFESRGGLLLSLTVMFAFAIFLRYLSYVHVKHIFSPKFSMKKGSYFSFWAFLKRYDNFGKFAVFHAVFNFAIMIASPFFAVYMLQDLQFDIFTFTILSASSTIWYLVFTPLAGKFSDKYGNVKLLWIAGLSFPLSTLFWIFFTDPVTLFFVPGMAAGIGNAALAIGVTNFTYDSTSQQKRGICLTYMGILNGTAVFVGSLVGGLFIEYLPITFMNVTLFVFALATGLRLLTAVVFLPFIKEPRNTEKVQGLVWDIHHPFRTIYADARWFAKFVHSK